MKTWQAFSLTAVAGLVAISGVMAQQEAPTAELNSSTFKDKLANVESIGMRFDQSLSAYVVEPTSHQGARDRAAQVEEARSDDRAISKQMQDLKRQQADASERSDAEAAGRLAGSIEEIRNSMTARVRQRGNMKPQYYDVTEVGADFIALSEIGGRGSKIVLPLSRIAYLEIEGGQTASSPER
ncbi:MAG: hypothetical protein U0795_08050 [Pirellulales bacterium]